MEHETQVLTRKSDSQYRFSVTLYSSSSKLLHYRMRIYPNLDSQYCTLVQNRAVLEDDHHLQVCIYFATKHIIANCVVLCHGHTQPKCATTESNIIHEIFIEVSIKLQLYHYLVIFIIPNIHFLMKFQKKEPVSVR